MSAAWEDPMVVNHDNNGAFNGTIDPSQMGFNPTPDSFDFGHMQNTPTGMPQHLQNGIQRNGSPAGMQQPPFQTTSVVPSKRPHTDTFPNSPRQASRSITPQQGQFPGAYNTSNGQPTPNPMQNFGQVNSSTASPSPVMPTQHFNVNGNAQNRMQTASPSPFSPAATNAGLNMSPAPSDFSGQGDGAQPNGVAPFPQGNMFVNGHGGAGSPGFHPQMNPMTQQGGGQMPANMVPQSTMDPMEQQRRLAQIRQSAPMGGGMGGGMAAGMAGGMAGAMGGMVGTPQRPGSMPQGSPSDPRMAHIQQRHRFAMEQMMHALERPVPPENFNQHVASFNQGKGRAFNPSLNVGGRDVLPANLYGTVMRMGGSQAVMRTQKWPQVAQRLSLEVNHQNAQALAQSLAAYWQQNLGTFEMFMLQNHQRKMNEHRQQLNQMSASIMNQARQPRQQVQGPPNSSIVHMRKVSGAEAQGPPQMSPQGFQGQPGMFPQGNQPRPGTQGSMTMTMPPQPHPTKSTPTRPPTAKRPSSTAGQSQDQVLKENEPSAGLVRQSGPQHIDRSDTFVADKFDFYHGMPTERWGALIEEAVIFRTTEALEEARPERPLMGELGTIDIHNLNMSLKSGLTGEVRLALDILWELTRQPFSLDPSNRQISYIFPLSECDDLLDTLVECAEEQVDLLSDNAEETSEEVKLPSYEDLIRRCEQEVMTVQDVHHVGSAEYDLERAVERLTSIMAILQNLACFDERIQHSQQQHLYEANVRLLSEQSVIRFVCNAIRNIGTRVNLLRTQRFTLDFFKDALLFLSNVAAQVELPGKDETLCILQLILSFGQTIPSGPEGDKVATFSPQDPEQNRYLRFAVDALAKLLARDEPNRGYFKSILASDAPYDLLTQTFALAIAPVPDEVKLMIPILQWRQSYLPQGLLAADILTTILPSDANALAQSWLYSPDGWSSNLIRLIIILGIDTPPMPPVPNRPSNTLFDYDIHMAIVERSLNILYQLAEKAKDADSDKKGRIKACRLTSKSLVIRALKIDAYMHVLNHMNQLEPHPMRLWMREVLKKLNRLMDLGV